MVIVSNRLWIRGTCNYETIDTSNTLQREHQVTFEICIAHFVVACSPVVDLLSKSLVHRWHEMLHLRVPAPITIANQDIVSKGFLDFVEERVDAFLQ